MAEIGRPIWIFTVPALLSGTRCPRTLRRFEPWWPGALHTARQGLRFPRPHSSPARIARNVLGVRLILALAVSFFHKILP